MGDSGAVFTIETTMNSELIDTSFRNFALEMVGRSHVKALTNNYENKASLWMNFENSFRRSTGMKKVNFGFSNLFGSGHFLIHHFWKKWLRNDWSQKIFCSQKSVVSYNSTTQEFFQFIQYFQTFYSELWHSCALPFLRQNL